MPQQQPCSLCGAPIQFAQFEGKTIKLDVTPSYDAPYRLVGEDQDAAERITRPGFYGYALHDETCPKTIR